MKLPVADGPALRRETRTLLRRHRGALTVVVALHAAAACAGLAGPWLLGRLIDAVAVGTTSSYVDRTVAVLVVAVLAQTVLIRYAQRSAMVLGESVFAELREEFLSTVTRLPLSIVERAGTGDLIARTTTDIDRVQYTVRFGVPRLLVSGATIALTAVAAALTSPLVALGLLAGLPLLLPVARWYLRRAAPAYLRESAAYAAQAESRGAEVMRAFQEGWKAGGSARPLVVFQTYGYSLPRQQSGGDRVKLAAQEYGLLAPFMDGMYAVADNGVTIVDGFEFAYAYKDEAAFKDARELVFNKVPAFVADKAKYMKHTSLGIGLWMDYDWRKYGWDEKDESKNFFKPAEFEQSLKLALQHADRYVWVYTEKPKWWTPAGNGATGMAPAYSDAIRRAKMDGS